MWTWFSSTKRYLILTADSLQCLLEAFQVFWILMVVKRSFALAEGVLELRGLVMAYGTCGHREFLSGVENINPLTRQHMPPRTHLPKTFVPCVGCEHNLATNFKCCSIPRALNDVGFSYGRNLITVLFCHIPFTFLQHEWRNQSLQKRLFASLRVCS